MEKIILEEIKNTLKKEKNKDIDSISLFDVIKLIDKKHWNFEDKKHELEQTIFCNSSIFYPIGKTPFKSNFDYNNNELIIDYCGETVSFKKEFDNLKIVKLPEVKISIDERIKELLKEILVKSGTEVSSFYDECLNYRGFNTESNEAIKSTNSNFIININKDRVEIIINSNSNNKNTEDFKLVFETKENNYRNYNFKYKYYYNSNEILSLLRNNEDEILKRIFVKIEDCPKWMHTDLKKIRGKQMFKIKPQIFIKKLIPFIKK